MRRDRDGVHHQLVARELHLPPGDVVAGAELQVRAGRGMGEDRLVEPRLDLVEVGLLDQYHRALPDRRHGIVGRVNLADTQPRGAGAGHKARFQQFVVRRFYRSRVQHKLDRQRIVLEDRFARTTFV